MIKKDDKMAESKTEDKMFRGLTHEKSDVAKAPEYFSQNHEDQILYENFFSGKHDGVFVELGALDGIRFGNTKFFEDTMGWRGALIEGSPPNAERLKKNRLNGRNLIIPEAVCAEGVDYVDFLVGGNADVSGMADTMTDEFLDYWHTGPSEHHVNVTCRPLGVMLEQLVNFTGSDHVDFFSLDVEGGELAVLQTNDWKVPVHLFLVEMDGHNETKDEAVRQLLYSHGYVKSSVIIPSFPHSEIFTSFPQE